MFCFFRLIHYGTLVEWFHLEQMNVTHHCLVYIQTLNFSMNGYLKQLEHYKLNIIYKLYLNKFVCNKYSNFKCISSSYGLILFRLSSQSFRNDNTKDQLTFLLFLIINMMMMKIVKLMVRLCQIISFHYDTLFLCPLIYIFG